MSPTLPSSRRAGWQLGPLSLKQDHCGPPNGIRAGDQSFAEMFKRKLAASAIIRAKEQGPPG
jgi:hypothetical protein